MIVYIISQSMMQEIVGFYIFKQLNNEKPSKKMFPKAIEAADFESEQEACAHPTLGALETFLQRAKQCITTKMQLQRR
jgi:hypothetical protein